MKLNIFPHSGDDENAIATIFKYIAVIDFIGGILGGFWIASNEYLGFMWGTFLIIAISSIITGMLFLGFAEVIKLLQLKQTQQYYIELPESFINSMNQTPSGCNSTNHNSSTTINKPSYLITCPECKTTQRRDRAKCWECGYEFAEEDKKK